MTDPVKARIIELVPARGFVGMCMECRFISRYGMEDYHSHDCTRDRPITLPDVLRAISILYTGYGEIKWNLLFDYDGQTQEVKDFIGKLLWV